MPFIDTESLQKRLNGSIVKDIPVPTTNADDFLSDNIPEDAVIGTDDYYHGKVPTVEFVEMRRADSFDIPIPIKKVISLLGNDGNESQKDIARTFGLSQPAVSNYTNGELDSRTHRENKELAPILENVSLKRQHIEMKALDALFDTMDILPDKIRNVSKAKDLASIAKDLALISNSVSGKDADKNSGNKIIFNIVPQRDINDYDIVDGVIE